MRYSFMSFSLPDATLAELIDAARSYGYEGLEPRIDGGHGHGVERGTDAGERRRMRDMLRAGGIDLPCVASGARLSNPASAPQQIADVRGAVDLARDLGSHRVRVFGGAFPPDLSRERAQETLAAALRELAPYAEDHDVILALETHDAWTNPDHVAAVMRAVDHPAVGVNWDVMHPSRTGGSTLECSHEMLRPWIRHVHMHDATSDPQRLEFRPMGEGDFDHRLILSMLRADGYDGYLSGEWIDWEPGEIHLPRELTRMREYEHELAGTSS